MFNIISKTKYAYIFSITLMVLSVVSLFMWGLKFGIDFTSGTLMEVQFANTVPANQEIENVLQELNLKSLTLQSTNKSSVLIRYASEDAAINQKVSQKISDAYKDSKELRVEFTDPSVSSELKSKSLRALFWATMGIMAFIAWAFRKVSRPIESWKYGAGAVIALIHDVLITVGVFSILGHFKGVEVGVPFIAALLTILGFSVHDTIVVYDRTRENLLKGSNKEAFPDMVNRSLNETLVRSINTSLTVVITLLALYIFGGDSIKNFALTLLIGVTFGTYSSIFIASALLVTSYNLQLKKR
ncbi:MAG: protein translocase subunit SecF [Candidatus Moranbacteria bacterium CG23_combo_of_CG06-09_8_20_14_all_39_10]|nr:MAG: protein translocase subunit SecF [Candidatus Moranbacteria bacterium CG23_combo_of_CG06-09_8_20_14_all_39_10]